MINVKSVSGHGIKKRNTLIYYLPGLMLLFTMIVVPQGHQKIKAVLLFITFAEVFLAFIMTHRFYLHPKIFHLFIFYIFLGLMYGIYGFARGNPGAVPITKEVALYVMFYMILVSGIRNHNSLKYVHKTLVFSACFVCVYMFVSYLYIVGIWPDWLYYDLSAETSTQSILATGFERHGKFEMVFSSYCNLMFLQPYLFFHLLVSKGKSSKSLWFAVIITTTFMIFSSSRALLVIALVFPLIITMFTFIKFMNRDNLYKGIGIIFISILLVTVSVFYLKDYGFNISMVIEDLLQGFSLDIIRPGGVVVENCRIAQALALFDAWKEKPLFGFGSGAAYWGYLRSSASPYSYEVSFAQFLYNWGIVGCLLYAIGLYHICRISIRAYKEKSALGVYAMAATFGSLAFLTGSWTNPYLLRFDSLYVIFIPVAIVNLYLFERNQLKRFSRRCVEFHCDHYGIRQNKTV